MPQRIDIDDFKGVFTHADLSDLPNSISTELKNFRPVNGKLVKTYDFNDVDNVCPLVISGWTVINIYTYINENLTDGHAYVAVIREDASPFETRIVWFVDSYNPTSEPSKLAPFGADSFWMQLGDSQDYVDAGFALIMSTVFEDGTGATHAFYPPTQTDASWHIPNEIDNGDSTSIFGGVPSAEGVGYPVEEALHSDLDGDFDVIANRNAYGVDGHASFTGRVKDFSTITSVFDYALAIHAVKRHNDVTYCAVNLKSGSDYIGTKAGDIIMYYDNGWSIIDLTDAPFSYNVGAGANSTIVITNFTVWGGRFYMGVMYYDHTGTGYNHDFWYVDFDTLANSAKVFSYVAGASPIYEYGIGDVTTATATYTTEKLFVMHRYDAKPSSSSVGGLFYYLEASDTTTGSANAVALPSGLGAAVYTSQCIYRDDETNRINLSYNVDSVAGSAVISDLTAIAPTWSNITLPTAMTGADAPVAPFTIDQITDAIGYTYGGEDYATYVMYITDDEGFAGWHIVQYDGNEWSCPERKTVAYTPEFIAPFMHNDRTGNHVIISFSGSDNILVRLDGDSATSVTEIASNSDGQPYTCFDSYEITHNHLSVIDALYGIDDSSNGHPTLYKFLTIGANPDWASWNTSMEFQYDVTACVAWQMAVAGDLPTMTHKNAQNPMVLDDGILRVYAGAIDDERNIWIGYIDRDFFFGAYSPDAGFFGYPNTPELPTTWDTSIAGFTGVAGSGEFDMSGGKTSYMFVPVFDGVQEALRNKSIVRTTDTDNDKVLEINLDIDTDDFPARVTAINVYRSSDDLVWGLVKTINTSSTTSNQDYHGGATSIACSYTLYVGDADISEVASGQYVRINTNDYEVDSVDTANGTITIETLGANPGPFGPADFLWGGSWAVYTAVAAGGTKKASGSGGYCGTDVLFSSSWDWGALELAGWNAHASATSSDFYVIDSYKSVIRLFSDVTDYTGGVDGTNVITSITDGYRFEDGSDNAWTIKVFDTGLTEGVSFPLDGAVSIKVNSDYATVISNRMWQGRVVLDAGGENEEQFSAITYSELSQLDVTPVSNLIRLNDREGGGITGITEIFGRPVVTMKQGISLIDSKTYPDDPTKWRISESVHNIGNIAKHGMVSAIGTVYVCYYDGIYGLDANNLAETDQTPTERLKISQDIDEVYQAISDKTAIIGEYDQQRNEIVWNFGSEVWAYSLIRGDWREISTQTTIDILTIDENADLLAFDEGDGDLRSLEVAKTTTVGTTQSTWRSKRYAFSLDRKSLVRELAIYYDSDDDFTINVYLNDSNSYETTTYTVAKRAGENVRRIPLKRYARNFQVEIVTEDSTNSFELHKIRLEVEE